MQTTAQIWSEYNAKLHAFIARRVEDRSQADDILQDVFLRTHRRLGELRDGERLQSWLYQIARNAIIDHHRARRLPVADAGVLAAESPESNRDAVRELAECLRPMIDLLPEHYREALVQADIEGLTQREIAERHGISLSGAKSRVQRARALLREQLDACCRFEFDRRGHLVGFQPHACDDECGSGC